MLNEDSNLKEHYTRWQTARVDAIKEYSSLLTKEDGGADISNGAGGADCGGEDGEDRDDPTPGDAGDSASSGVDGDVDLPAEGSNKEHSCSACKARPKSR